MATSPGAPPGGWDLHELHTDLAAVYLGFGIFLANSARSFQPIPERRRHGLVVAHPGLSERRRAGHRDRHLPAARRPRPSDAAPHLKDYLRKDLRKAESALAKRFPDMAAAVEAIDLAEFGCD